SASEIGPKEDIDDILSNAAKEALNDITKGNYHDRVKENAIKIIDLGLVIYGSGQKIQAQFG
ncbi:MAG: hypothetical protein LBE31_12165, partial [Deltaproteobacteria bacterium]|nr:hypothetical protein [Deltaproteobacteria bacterium]